MMAPHMPLTKKEKQMAKKKTAAKKETKDRQPRRSLTVGPDVVFDRAHELANEDGGYSAAELAEEFDVSEQSIKNVILDYAAESAQAPPKALSRASTIPGQLKIRSQNVTQENYAPMAILTPPYLRAIGILEGPHSKEEEAGTLVVDIDREAKTLTIRPMDSE